MLKYLAFKRLKGNELIHQCVRKSITATFTWLQLSRTHVWILALKSRTAAISLDANLCGDNCVNTSHCTTQTVHIE